MDNAANWLRLLFHGFTCMAQHGQACPLQAHCGPARELLRHLLLCDNPECCSTCLQQRKLLLHYVHCQDAACQMCNLVAQDLGADNQHHHHHAAAAAAAAAAASRKAFASSSHHQYEQASGPSCHLGGFLDQFAGGDRGCAAASPDRTSLYSACPTVTPRTSFFGSGSAAATPRTSLYSTCSAVSSLVEVTYPINAGGGLSRGNSFCEAVAPHDCCGDPSCRRVLVGQGDAAPAAAAAATPCCGGGASHPVIRRWESLGSDTSCQETVTVPPVQLASDNAPSLLGVVSHHLIWLLHHGLRRGSAHVSPHLSALDHAASPPCTLAGGQFWKHILTCGGAGGTAGETAGGTASYLCRSRLCVLSKHLLHHRVECDDPGCRLCGTVCDHFRRAGPLAGHEAGLKNGVDEDVLASVMAHLVGLYI